MFKYYAYLMGSAMTAATADAARAQQLMRLVLVCVEGVHLELVEPNARKITAPDRRAIQNCTRVRQRHADENTAKVAPFLSAG